MSGSSQEHWQDVAKKIAEERDPRRVSRLVEELLLALGSTNRPQKRDDAQESS
jgi:hypothetical protein